MDKANILSADNLLSCISGLVARIHIQWVYYI